MRRRAAAEAPAEAVERIKRLLDNFLTKLNDDDLRDQVRSLVPAFETLRGLGKGLIPPDLASSARERILLYFQRYPLQVIEGDELLVVAGIGEWARRVRELRVQFGWSICSGVTFKDLVDDEPELAASLKDALGADPRKLKPDQYVMVSTEEDREAAHRWNLLNTIRKKKGLGVRARLLEYMRANVGSPVSIEELRYLAGDKSEWARRMRELRTEEGWPIYTRMQGRPELPVGTYVLDEDKQAPEHDRRIPDDVRVEVLIRDDFTCRVCGWTRDLLRPDDPRKFLELHHLVTHSEKGENSVENLITLCNVHHDKVHAGRLTLDV
ncbi:MAG: HNH endonuclease [Allosphingosinicella sp.]|uniref:HNH endonuclease n=1 Tax=Allosphingosinicella sp. TaxID=2823234 RepID=UPI00394A4F62